MTDRSGGLEAQGSDRLPWLEAVDDEDERDGIGSGKLVAGVIVALLAIGLVIGGIFWLRDGGNGASTGEPGLIAAQPGDYKVKPDAPGGMQVEGRGDAAYATSEGADPNAPIDLSAVPEAPVAGRPAAPAAAPKPAPDKPAATATAKVEDKGEKLAAAPKPVPPATLAPPAAAPAAALGAGGAIQLGAFSSEAKANAAWKSLSGRFAFLAPLPKAVTPVTAGGSTLYRLRAGAAGQASNLCARLRVAGESCTVVN